MPSPIDPTNLPVTEVDLDVDGALPLGLSGRLVGIARDGVLHSLHFQRGRVSYLAHGTYAGAVVNDLVAFEGSILTYSDDSSVRQVSVEVATPRRVDLAGHRRTVAACPKYDSASGELHLVARDGGGAQTHVVVSAGALTRRSRAIDAPARIQGLAIGSDHVVFVADGVVGVAPRDSEAHTTWMPTDIAAPSPVHTHRAGNNIVLLALTPALERWILHPEGGAIEREVLDPTPRHFAHLSDDGLDGAPRWVWTTGDDTIGRHDLIDSCHAHRSLRPRLPGDFVVVPDTARPDDIDGGWLVGLVRDPSSATTDLRVMDAVDITEPPAASVRIPRQIPHGLRCTWIPSTQH
jgi:carotenoid cleavage dioxygenase-like enzyme